MPLSVVDETEDVARSAYAAYADSDREALEPLIADDFTFSSPDDPQLDRAEAYYGASA